jgi:hypothetical protein
MENYQNIFLKTCFDGVMDCVGRHKGRKLTEWKLLVIYRVNKNSKIGCLKYREEISEN